MTYFSDLTTYEFISDAFPDEVVVLNVGWLEPEHDFPVRDGELDPVLAENLITLADKHFTVATRGIHGCRLPHPEGKRSYGEYRYGDRAVFLGHAQICVVALDGRWLTAPTLVVHYVIDHAYQPPDEFVEAVKAMRIAPTGY